MALTLNEVLLTSQSKYRLTQLCGQNGLNRVMSWVYISEDITTASFLKGGELIITTGVSCRTPNWLYEFIETLIARGTCGLIVNVGSYIKREDITDDILALCESHNFPLFTMPWEIHIYDISRDYYNRILLDSQTDTTITNAFLAILRNTDSLTQALEALEPYHFACNSTYCVSVVGYQPNESSTSPYTDEQHKKIQSFIEHFIKINHLGSHMVPYKDELLIISCKEEVNKLSELMKLMQHDLSLAFEGTNFHIGIGGAVSHLTDLSTSLKRGKAALSLSYYHDTPIYHFDDMGFLKVLLSVNDKSLLVSYMEDHLKKIIDYDALHNTDYLETLHNYLIHNGSIQLIASAMFCHRNTINYRIHVIKDVLDFDLDSTEIRFNLMVSFAIKEYLEILA